MDHSRKFPAFSTSKFKMIWDAEGARCYAHQVCSHIRVEIRESRHLSVLIHPGEKSGFLILVFSIRKEDGQHMKEHTLLMLPPRDPAPDRSASKISEEGWHWRSVNQSNRSGAQVDAVWKIRINTRQKTEFQMPLWLCKKHSKFQRESFHLCRINIEN